MSTTPLEWRADIEALYPPSANSGTTTLTRFGDRATVSIMLERCAQYLRDLQFMLQINADYPGALLQSELEQYKNELSAYNALSEELAAFLAPKS